MLFRHPHRRIRRGYIEKKIWARRGSESRCPLARSRGEAGSHQQAKYYEWQNPQLGHRHDTAGDQGIENPLTEISWRHPVSDPIPQKPPHSDPDLLFFPKRMMENFGQQGRDNDRRPLMNEWWTLGQSSAGFPVINWICCARVIRTSTCRDTFLCGRQDMRIRRKSCDWLDERERWHGSRYQGNCT